jgi:hypothetical protein
MLRFNDSTPIPTFPLQEGRSWLGSNELSGFNHQAASAVLQLYQAIRPYSKPAISLRPRAHSESGVQCGAENIM